MASEYIYLHGFASSPGSNKAAKFKKAFENKGLPLHIPDLDGGDFKHLTLSRQMHIVQQVMERRPPGTRFFLIGSSMGGYLAVLMAHTRNDIDGLYLMAPGFNFLTRWEKRLFEENPDLVEIPRLIKVFNYRYTKIMELDTGIFGDAEIWDKLPLEKNLPIRIVHGRQDESVNIEGSREFVKTRPWANLVELDSDHGLFSHIDWIVEDCLGFLSDAA